MRPRTMVRVPQNITQQYGPRIDGIQRLYASGERVSEKTFIGRINNLDVKIFISTSIDYDYISNRTLGNQITRNSGANHRTLSQEDQVLLGQGLPIEISNNTNIIAKRLDNETIIEFSHFIITSEKMFVSGSQSAESYIIIGNRTMESNQIIFDAWKNQISVPNPLYQTNPEKPRLKTDNFYNNTDLANNLPLSNIEEQEYYTQSENEELEVNMIQEINTRPRHKGKKFSIIILKGNKKTWISKRINPEKIYHNNWQYPGGKIEKNEEYKEGAIRELAEETGIIKLKRELEHILTDKYEGIICKIYITTLKENEKPELKEPTEMTKWKEIEPEELRNYIMTPSIEKNKEQIIRRLNENF